MYHIEKVIVHPTFHTPLVKLLSRTVQARWCVPGKGYCLHKYLLEITCLLLAPWSGTEQMFSHVTWSISLAL